MQENNTIRTSCWTSERNQNFIGMSSDIVGDDLLMESEISELLSQPLESYIIA